MQHILVTGGAGFIGSHTVDLLLREGFRVTVLDNLSSGSWRNLPESHPELQCIEGDILDLVQLSDLVAQVDAVLHLAALVSVPASFDDPLLSLRVNTQGFLHVLQVIRESGRSIRLVYASSAAVYGDTLQSCLESRPLSGEFLSPYALQKAGNECYATLYQQLAGLSTLGLRYFNVYGSGQSENSPYAGVIAKFMDNYKQDKVLNVFGDGRQTRDFIHVSDVARANVLALRQSYCGVLNIATGYSESLLDLIGYLEQAGGKKARLNFLPLRAGDIRHSSASIDAALQSLGFQTVVSLRAGIFALFQGESSGVFHA